MHRFRSRLIVAALTVTLAAPLVGLAPPAGAAVATNGCLNSALPGAEIGHFPAQPASQSGLRVSCSFRNDTGNNIVSGRFSIHDFDVANYHNGAARYIDAPAIAASSTTFAVAAASECSTITPFINRPISDITLAKNAPGSTGFAPRTFVTSIVGAGPCTVTLSDATVSAIGASDVIAIDNAHARGRTDVATTLGSTTITSATANFTGTDVGCSVGGTFIPPDSTISVINSATSVTFTNSGGPAGATATATGQTVSFCGSLLSTNTRSVTNAFISSGTAITSGAPAWAATDCGLRVTGTGIPASAYVSTCAAASATITAPSAMTPTGAVATPTPGAPACTNEVQTISRNAAAPFSTALAYIGIDQDGAPGGVVETTGELSATSSAAVISAAIVALDTRVPGDVVVTGGPWPAAVTLTYGGTLGCLNVPPASLTQRIIVGDVSVTAPAATDTVMNQGVQLNLNPVLVAGSDACFNNTTEGFGTVAQWRNPGSFAGVGVNNAQPGNTKVIGQFYFETSVTDFSAFLVQRPLLAAGDPQGNAHFDIMFPSAPTTAALCASSPTSTGLGISIGVHPTTVSQAVLASGFGKPGTAQFRNIVPQAGAGYPGYLSTAYVKSDDPAITFPDTPTGPFNRLCSYPAGAPNVAFGGANGCGNG